MQYSKPIQVEEIKADNDDWEVSGYVAAFNNIDQGDDIVMPGAFAKTLASGPRVRFLLSHDPRLVLGTAKKLYEDTRGLFGRFKISRTQIGADTRQLLLDGAIDSFSFGYDAKEFDIVDKKIRRLKTITLYEASLVPIPMNPEAVVTGVKEYLTLAEKTAGLSKELSELLSDLRGLTEQERPLNEAKRKELTELLEKFSGLDDVRADLQSVLSTAPTRLAGPRLISYQLSELRKKYAAQE